MKSEQGTHQSPPLIFDASGDSQYYSDHIPAYAVKAIDLLYGSIRFSILFLRLQGKLTRSASTYVSRLHGEIRAVFVFERVDDVVTVLNEKLEIEQEEVTKFAEFIFRRIPEVVRICFTTVKTEKLRIARPYQRFFSGEDLVISDIGSAEVYTKMLGKSTAKNIRRRAAELEHAHPGFRFDVVTANEINETLVARIIDFNRARMSNKNKLSTYKDEDSQLFAAMAANDGLVGMISIDESLCAGSVCCRIGCSYTMVVGGHNPAYDEFSLGLLCNHWTLLECLRSKVKDFNLMSGRLPYKYAMLARPRKYDYLTIYRNYSALRRDAIGAIDTAVRGYATEAKFALLDCEHKDGKVAKSVARAVRTARKTKKILLRWKERFEHPASRS